MNKTERPNILFIHTDQQRADSLGCYGNTVIRTPNLDQLAASGTLFENAHCTHPLCMPSRATLLTGRYMHAHRLYRNGIPLSKQEQTIAHLLSKSGYATALIGKAHFTPYKGDPKVNPESVQINNGVAPEECWAYWQRFEGPYYGFDHVQMSMGHGDYGMMGGHYGLWVHEQHPDKVPLFDQDIHGEPSDGVYRSWKSAVPLEIHSSTWTTNKAIEFIKQNKDRPFYAWIGYQEPHEPFNPPRPYCDMYDPQEILLPVGRDGEWGSEPPEHVQYYLNRGKWKDIREEKVREIIAHYYGCVSMIDDCIGRLMKTLEEEGLADNTIIVFTSDHGEWLGDHGLWLKGAVHARGLTRIPLMIKWPGTTVSGRRVSNVASLIDVMPTLLDAAGAEIPYGVQGTSLRSVLAGEQDKVRDYALIEHRHEPYHLNIQLEKEELVINKGREEWHMKTIVTDRYRLSYIPSAQYGELYDHQTDPDELNNLWDKFPELRVQLQLQLLDSLIETEEVLPRRIWQV
ncbi:sulfatase [Paenibacillus sp. MB22_1]|uniref:sulfatase family protein n=1 Tax=Paenibacillus sp. MB22_1 TaxID=3383121 RepID=UPI0039A1D6F9